MQAPAEVGISNENKPVEHGRTLSSQKRRVEAYYSAKARHMRTAPATVAELTEAEQLFQSNLTGQKENATV